MMNTKTCFLTTTLTNISFFYVIFFLPTLVSCTTTCTCDTEQTKQNDENNKTLHYKLGSIASILICGAVGVSLPLLSKRVPILSPNNDLFFMIKAFAAGVILSTGFIHILPEAFEKLNSPCLKENIWGNFPFAGFVAMLSSIATLMVDSFASGYYHRQHFNNNNLSKQVPHDDVEIGGNEHVGHIHVHTHATHGHAHGSTNSSHDSISSELIRQRIISQVSSMCFFFFLSKFLKLKRKKELQYFRIRSEN